MKFPKSPKEVIFITEFVILCKNPPFCEVKKIFEKGFVHGRISKIFFLDHFSPFHIFRPKTLILGAYLRNEV
jgi:hypothetical protein